MAVLGVLQEQPARGNAVGPVQAEETVHDTQVQEEEQMKEYYEKVCQICGAEFIARHGNKRTCPTCTQIISRGKGRNLPRRYACPVDIELYEEKVRKQNIADHKDTIVAIGYADRQREQTLRMVGRVKAEL